MIRIEVGRARLIPDNIIAYMIPCGSMFGRLGLKFTLVPQRPALRTRLRIDLSCGHLLPSGCLHVFAWRYGMLERAGLFTFDSKFDRAGRHLDTVSHAVDTVDSYAFKRDTHSDATRLSSLPVRSIWRNAKGRSKEEVKFEVVKVEEVLVGSGSGN